MITKKEVEKIKSRYPSRIPILCTYDYDDKKKQQKFLVPGTNTMGEFMCMVRQRIDLKAKEALFLIIKGKNLPNSMLLSEVIALYAEENGYIHVNVCKENCFG